MRFTHAPLDTLHLTQPFGTNWAPDDLYKKLGMLGHNGLDFRAPEGTPVYAVADGWFDFERETVDFNNPRGYGINGKLYVKDGNDEELEVIYGHLQKIVAERGPVKGGQVIALADATGAATGSHLHFGVRRRKVFANGTKQVLDYHNGYFGWIDPTPYMADAEEFAVDARYGQAKSLPRELAFRPSALWFRSKVKRPITERESKAFIYGYWPFEAVIDPAMFVIWREMTLPDYAKLLKRKPEDIARGLRGY